MIIRAKEISTLGAVALLLSAFLPTSGCKKDADAVSLPPTAPVKGGAKEAAKAPRDKASTVASKSANTPQRAAAKAGGPFGVLTGTTRAAKTSMLAPQISGSVVKVLVREGDVVSKGQVLVMLDRSDILLRLRQAKAARATAAAQLAAVRKEWKRLSGLLSAKAIPRGQFDKVDSQYKVAQTGMAQAEVAISMAKSALRKASIKAPYRAVVTAKMTEVGAYATVMPPSPLLKLEQIDPLEVWVQVPEANMRHVKTGTPLELRFSALQKVVNVAVQRVIPTVNPRTRSFSAIATLKNPDHLYRPGMFVEVRAASAGGKK